MPWDNKNLWRMYLAGDFQSRAAFFDSPEYHRNLWESEFPEVVEKVRADLQPEWPLDFPCPEYKIIEVIINHGDGDDGHPLHASYCRDCYQRVLLELREWAKEWTE
jgi:hypothetical protein